MQKSVLSISFAFIILVVATLVALYLGKNMHLVSGSAMLLFVLLMLKGQQIVDHFMELKTAATKWRVLLLSYVVLVPALIALILYG